MQLLTTKLLKYIMHIQIIHNTPTSSEKTDLWAMFIWAIFDMGQVCYGPRCPDTIAEYSVECASDWRPGGRGFNPCRGQQHSFVENDHEIFSTVILSLPLIQVVSF